MSDEPEHEAGPPPEAAAPPAPVAEPQPEVAPTPAAAPPAAPAAAPPGGLAGYLKQPAALLHAGVVAVIALACVFLFGPLSDLLTPTVKAYATRDLDVTSATNQTSILLGHLQRGDVISGKWVNGPGGEGRWLKVQWPARDAAFIWAPDLSLQARPQITPVNPNSPLAAGASVVYAEPDAKSSVIDSLAKGEMAVVNGITTSGWEEVNLNAGGVGYVHVSAFSGAAPGPNVDAPPQQIAALAGVTHYVCSFAPEQSRDAPANTQPLSFYLDEGRACIDHRFAYFPDDVGGLKRVMLSDKDRRASLLYFMPDRKSFYRTDFTLAPDDYAKLQRSGAALESEICSPPADAAAKAVLQKVLVKATPTLDVQAPGAVWQRRVWQCVADR